MAPDEIMPSQVSLNNLSCSTAMVAETEMSGVDLAFLGKFRLEFGELFAEGEVFVRFLAEGNRRMMRLVHYLQMKYPVEAKHILSHL